MWCPGQSGATPEVPTHGGGDGRTGRRSEWFRCRSWSGHLSQELLVGSEIQCPGTA
jgi:hypothetical protein